MPLEGKTSVDMSLRCFVPTGWEEGKIELIAAQITLPFRWPTLESCEAPCEATVHRETCFEGGVTAITKTQLSRSPDPAVLATAKAYQGVTYSVDDEELFNSLVTAESLPVAGRYSHTANEDLSEKSSTDHSGSSTAHISTYGLVGAKALGDPSQETCALAELRNFFQIEAVATAECAIRTEVTTLTRNTDHSRLYHSGAFQLKSGLLVRTWCP